MKRVNYGSFTEEESAQAIEDGFDCVTDETAIEIIVKLCRNHSDPIVFTGELLANLDALNEELGG